MHLLFCRPVILHHLDTVYIVKSMLYVPDAPLCKVLIFFLKDERFIIRPYFLGQLYLKEPRFRWFRQDFLWRKMCEIFRQYNVRSLGNVGKIYQGKTMCQRRSSPARWRPILYHQAESTVWRKTAYSNDDGFKLRKYLYIWNCLHHLN